VSRIVVIGAGVGGLAAAARLAAAGHEVVVHERSAVVGGKLGVYDRDGFLFDTGPSCRQSARPRAAGRWNRTSAGRPTSTRAIGHT
jgi:phytoene dehydrogenase-like protein